MLRTNWTKEETIIAFNVYCKVPFKASSKTHPIIIAYAKILGRTPSALNMKIGNFGRLDPELKKQGITGLTNGSKLEEEVWNEFNGDWERLSYESEELIAKFQNRKIEESNGIVLQDLPEGKDREAVVKTRVNQSFFRSAVLSSYNLRCCITGLSIPDLLVASHIKPWAIDQDNRTNPRNGLCLNAIHDKAFDLGYITVTPEYRVLVSDYFNDYADDIAVTELFYKYQSRPIFLPDKFLPAKEFLDWHMNSVFKK
ncbi:HNH endonuclease [Porphyromonas loveana]|uniref:Putative restriction endonuclease n=1 Tax=Porphyromonas loveana TaxID=1884669 RepID=A0A2U1FHD8_9PORP|nr:HNH endonuclease [Porphyromonas loveana]PVZ11566.1 putative restriction endonuclease [Porphyromonas loveana]